MSTTIKKNLDINTNYTSGAANEIIVVQMRAINSGDRYDCTVLLLDASGNTQEQVGRSSVQWNQGSDAWMMYNTLTVPIPPNTRYRIEGPTNGVDAYYFHL